VRKPLIARELLKHSFLKSVEEFENKGFISSLFVQKSEKSERVKKERELSAEEHGPQSAQRGGKEIWAGLATNMGNDSTDFDYCQGLL
jgi:hypothetical protein